jgi:hypothetical protein
MTAILSQVQARIKTDLAAALGSDGVTPLLARVYWGCESNETAMPYAECYFNTTAEKRPDAAFFIDTDCNLQVHVTGDSEEQVSYAIERINKLWLTDANREALRLLGCIYINVARRDLPLPQTGSMNTLFKGAIEFDLTVRDTY